LPGAVEVLHRRVVPVHGLTLAAVEQVELLVDRAPDRALTDVGAEPTDRPHRHPCTHGPTRPAGSSLPACLRACHGPRSRVTRRRRHHDDPLTAWPAGRPRRRRRRA
jgi:hypothetical protein